MLNYVFTRHFGPVTKGSTLLLEKPYDADNLVQNAVVDIRGSNLKLYLTKTHVDLLLSKGVLKAGDV